MDKPSISNNTPQLHRAWAEIDLDALVFNYEQVRATAQGAEVMCVIKADAYGHGAPMAARALAEAGCRRFAVATAEEAMQLRRHGIAEPILLLGMVPHHWAPEMARLGVAMAVGTPECAAGYAATMKDSGESELGIHLKVDTGMRRVGLWQEDAVARALAIAATPGLRVEGIFTHFCAADEQSEDGFTEIQLARFNEVCEGLEHAGLVLPLRHCANSAGIIAHPASHMDMVRPGIVLYGSNPTQFPFQLRAPLSLRSRVVQVKPVVEGESVSYGRTWYAQRPSLIATLGIGYADGLMRSLSGKIDVLIRGRKARQVGRICMDMCMVDVTDIPGVKPGDIATLIGADGNELITADDMAAAAGTISYEVFCAVGRRVPRVYVQGGKELDTRCYVDAL